MIVEHCEGTVRMPLDKNASAGVILCQQRYWKTLMNEQETSAAQFEVATGTETEVSEELRGKYKTAMLGTVATFDANGNLYNLPKDKNKLLEKLRPLQPNFLSPIAWHTKDLFAEDHSPQADCLTQLLDAK
ncbi:hypothetical protein CYMTET_41564 [Cymbomonas tetramitiformis]|uniref:Uncharacterized protein n=1 Tax=Cymbomonas tetramitiformis TaxID=36881 RepID=A0AAE0F3H3_9CHLO|nr:hypothetical protein CYMTET_41564 [Cymbomonas tetramitiformis]